MRLRSKILWLALPLTLIPFVLTALAVYYFVIRGQQIRTDEELNKLLSEAVANLRKEQKAARDDVELIATLPAVVDYLEAAADVANGSSHLESQEAEARTVLRLFFDRSPYYFHLSLADTQGQERIKFTKLPGGQALASIKGEDYFLRTLIIGSFQSPITSIGPDRFAAILTNRVGRKFAGVVVLQLNTDAFQRSIRPLLASRGLNTFLFDDRGVVFAKSFAGADEEECISRIDLAAQAGALLSLPSLELSTGEIVSRAREFVFSILPAESYRQPRLEPQAGENWFLGVIRDKPSAQPETVTFQIIFATILFSAVGAVMWTTTLFAKRIAAPLEQVSNATSSIAQGDFDIDVSVKTGDEVEALAAAVTRMADDLKRYRAELVRSAKLATIGEMASEISHEIQNRISGVSLWTQYLDAELAPDDPKREYIEEMKAGLRGFTSLLAGLKQFYRTPLLQLSDIDLNGLVQSTLRSVEPQLNQRHIHLETSLEASLPAIKCDAEKIKGVILNLIVNAIEAVDDGGHIAVRTSATESGEKGASIKLSVTDNGCGIEEKDLARVFYPFYSTKGGGSGLGLAIASNVVSAHGGTMSVESQPRQATTFTAILKPGGPGDGENPVDGR